MNPIALWRLVIYFQCKYTVDTLCHLLWRVFFIRFSFWRSAVWDTRCRSHYITHLFLKQLRKTKKKITKNKRHLWSIWCACVFQWVYSKKFHGMSERETDVCTIFNSTSKIPWNRWKFLLNIPIQCMLFILTVAY